MGEGVRSFALMLAGLQGNRCGICGKFVYEPWALTVDHVWPRSSQYGFGASQNHVAAHRGCNHRKGDRLPTGCELVWLASVNARLGEIGASKQRRRRAHKRRPLPPPTMASVWPA